MSASAVEGTVASAAANALSALRGSKRNSARAIAVAVSGCLNRYEVEEDAKQQERYMKGLYQCRGVKSQSIKALYSVLKQHVKTMDNAPQLFWQLALVFAPSTYFEEKIISTFAAKDSLPYFESSLVVKRVVQRTKKARNSLSAETRKAVNAENAERDRDELFAALRKYIDDNLFGWAVVDSLAGGFFYEALRRNENVFGEELEQWSRGGDSLWRQRIAAVAYVKLGSRGLYLDRLLRIAKNNLVSKNGNERFLQLGVGWAIRNYTVPPLVSVKPTSGSRTMAMSPKKREKMGESEESSTERALDFIREHIKLFSAEGLRYAIEKLPIELQKTLREERKNGR